jgi:hypothetical protein
MGRIGPAAGGGVDVAALPLPLGAGGVLDVDVGVG